MIAPLAASFAAGRWWLHYQVDHAPVEPLTVSVDVSRLPPSVRLDQLAPGALPAARLPREHFDPAAGGWVACSAVCRHAVQLGMFGARRIRG